MVGSNSLNNGVWYNMSFIFSDGVGKTYLNGMINQTKTASHNTLYLDDGRDLRIGVDHPGGPEFFNGFIDDIRIYNRALSPDEVEMIYRIEKPKVPLTNINFQTAVNLWFTDELNATMTYGHISDWNTSAVTDMSNAFRNRTTFNEDIGGWDIGNVTKLSNMFYMASSFNQDIGNWDTSSVVTMLATFQGATFSTNRSEVGR